MLEQNALKIRHSARVIINFLSSNRGFFDRQPHKLGMQLIVTFRKIQRNTIHRTHFTALWRIKMPYALGAFGGIDFVDFDALINRAIRTFWFADVAIYTFIGNF